MHWFWLPNPRTDRIWLADLLDGGEPPIAEAVKAEYTYRYLAEYARTGDRESARNAANNWTTKEIEELRHQTPDKVKKYTRIMEQGPPRCCHTCEHYRDDGLCDVYRMTPPEDFAATDDACGDYLQEVPF
jgi:hypothetical protein